MRTHCLARSQAQHKRDQVYKSSPIRGKQACPEVDWLAQSLYTSVYYRDWRRSIGSVLKILFFY